MTYADARAWLDGRSNLERRPDPEAWTRVKLERVERLMALLDHPERGGPRFVHIAGSKGKGSTSALVDSVLRAAGCRCGLYTSPDLCSRRERIRVDGEPIPREAVARLVEERLQPAAERYEAEGWGDELSFFDLHTALAFCWFAECGCEWAVVEVGLGGRLDATNVLTPTVCAITSLSYEHTAFLGTSLAQIAGEKGGIVKPGVPVVLAPQVDEALAVLLRLAAERDAEVLTACGVEPRAPLVEADGDRLGQSVAINWGEGEPHEVLLPLLGAHQLENAAVARTVLAALARVGETRLTAAAVAAGFAAVQWPGRLQVLARRPWLVLDGAHNPDSALRLQQSLALFPHERLWLVVGAARDKDVAGFLAELAPHAEAVLLCGLPGHPRLAEPESLVPLAREHCPRVAVAAGPRQALALAQHLADDHDLIVVTGSLYLVGAVLGLAAGAQR